jgi:hypothetical protein
MQKAKNVEAAKTTWKLLIAQRAMCPKQGIIPDGYTWIPSPISIELQSTIQRFHKLFPFIFAKKMEPI